MFLKELSEAVGVSGQEDEVRNLIRDRVRPHVEQVWTDALGNLLACKKAAASAGKAPRIMISAHMDEVGLMITGITSAGLLRFRPVGGIDPRVLVAKPVSVGKDRIPGVIGAKPIHLQQPEERETPFRLDDLYIDIGAESEKDAASAVHLGDLAAFRTPFRELGGGLVMGKALDNRVGCSILAEVLEGGPYPVEVCGAFTVQEEVGLRGAGVAAYGLKPDLAVVLEGTTAADMPGQKEHQFATTVGQGPALTLMDAAGVPSRPLMERLQQIALQQGIPFQFRRFTTGGTEAGRIQEQRGGIPAGTVSVPCRYIHSPAAVLSLKDREATVRLVQAFLYSVGESGVPVA